MLKKQAFIVLAIIMVGVSVSAFTGVKFFESETKNIQIRFEDDVRREVYGLDKEAQVNMEVLYALKGLYEGSDEVTLKEFREVAQSILERHKDIQALEWVPRITHDQREVYEREMREHYPEFEIVERQEQGVMVRAQDRDEYFFVYYIEPYAGNELVLGFDNASHPERLATLKKSRDTGNFMATGKIELVQGLKKNSGYIIFVPVYKGETSTLALRRKNLKGFVVAVFRVGHIFQKSLDGSRIKNAYIRLLDVTDPNEQELFYAHEQIANDEVARDIFQVRKEVPPIAGRQWVLEARPSKSYVKSLRSSFPFVIFALGLLLTFAAAGYVMMILRRSQEIEKVVNQRTNQLKIAQTKLESLARIDGLTGVSNRRFFDEYFDREWLRSIREKTHLGLLIIDVDFFKPFNDNYGHTKGDACLKKVALALKSCLHRPADLIARFGGEEFVILLPNTEDVTTVAEKCRSAVENLQIPHAYSQAHDVITISIGAAICIPNKNIDRIKLIQDADKALYQSKKDGRNRVSSG